MKLRIFTFLLFISNLLYSQVCNYPSGVNTTLVITEARFNSTSDAYLEITNLGSEPVRLSDYKFGTLNVWSRSSQVNDLCNDAWYTTSGDFLYLPDKMLDPGKSFVITNAYDYSPRHFRNGLGRNGGTERMKQPELVQIADKLIHAEEIINGIKYEEDSVTLASNDTETLINKGFYPWIFNNIQGKTLFIEHHYTEGDSAVIDQVGGVFDGGGRNVPYTWYDVAGVIEGFKNTVVVRKSTVKNGNIDFANARGVGLDDSEWIPLEMPEGYNVWRDLWWTVGNHGAFVLDENTLESTNDAIQVDYANKKITVPWGTRRLDEIMRSMKKRPGIAWNYELNPAFEDSLYRSARNGDRLTVMVAGAALQSATFDIEVKEPTADDNIVVPIDHPASEGPITPRTQNGILSWPRVTKHDSGVDTITGYRFGLEFDMRSDSLLKYLEKPEKATWEFVWVDGITRADLKNGDKLKVTSESGKVKEYFIQVQSHYPNATADLASITWPDIPDFYRGIFGWKGDTIPNFSAGSTIYRLEVPMDIEGVPALVAKTSHVNAKLKVKRAKSVSGTIEDRTVTFEVTAENDTIQKTYSVELFKEKHHDQIEPFHADPFFSEFVNSYGGNCYLEVYNPGNQPIDLRNYMFAHRYYSDPYGPIKWKPDWEWRYTTYIPGLKYVDEQTWKISPRILIPDPNVNPIIPGGGTFVMALIRRGDNYNPGILFPPYDINFANEEVVGHPNPWNERTRFTHMGGSPIPTSNRGGSFFMYKVLNDSVKNGLKPTTDPNDYQVIDIWGMPTGGSWVVGGYKMTWDETGNVFIRKPNITKGNPVNGGSFGIEDPTECEWSMYKVNTEFAHVPFPDRFLVGLGNLNQHYMIEPTFYKSTVNSTVYKVSGGFGPDEKILGLKTGITVAQFLASINREDEGQQLKIISNGTELAQDAIINKNDVLQVVSADNVNTTLYSLDVTQEGLSNNARLTSNRWDITVDTEPKSGTADDNAGSGSISGFGYGTTVKAVVENVTVPAGAKLTVVNGDDAYVPYTTINFDTTYVSVTVNPDIFFEVVAEDNETRIIYQLQPNTSQNDAFILSDVYEVSQVDNLIQFVPRGTNFQAFLSNIIPSLGASIQLVDKMGFERTQGNIREDDKVVVTSANGQTTRIYFISFLPTATILETTYLAYVLSEAYLVNQVNYVISAGLAPLTSETLLEEFINYIIPSMGATLTVVDKDGAVKSSGDLNDGDKLVVTSADGKIAVTYTLALDLTSNGQAGMQKQIVIFPNPASDKLQIRGVEAGNRIQIYSATGALISEMRAQSNLETIPLDQVPSGMFMIVVSDHNTLLGRYKAIRK